MQGMEENAQSAPAFALAGQPKGLSLRGPVRFGLIFAGLLRGNVAGSAHLIYVQPRGAEFGNLAAAACGERHFEDLRTDHSARGSFIHGKEVAADPVPALIAV